MKKSVVCIILSIIAACIYIPGIYSENARKISNYKALYSEMNLDGILNYIAFTQAMRGYERININKKDMLVVIDFSKPSTDKRMYVLDLSSKRLVYHTLVAHGRNSGENYATSFSNRPGSYQSSLGFYVTEGTYTGKNGYSLILEGLEEGINDKAKERAIVIHGADYCDPSIIKKAGRLGRSLGCPALPKDINNDVINTIKNGAIIYIYANDDDYMSRTSIL